jgi:hypothetical protein
MMLPFPTCVNICGRPTSDCNIFPTTNAAADARCGWCNVRAPFGNLTNQPHHLEVKRM